MKAYLINMHLLVPRSRSSVKVKVKYEGYISPKNGRFGGIRVSQTYLVCFISNYFRQDSQRKILYIARTVHVSLLGKILPIQNQIRAYLLLWLKKDNLSKFSHSVFGFVRKESTIAKCTYIINGM